MDHVIPFPGRRHFLRASAALTTGIAGASLISSPPAYSEDADENIIGPKKGYSPQLGTLVSEMNWMRTTMLMSVKGMTQKDLDFLLDAKANTIPARF